MVSEMLLRNYLLKSSDQLKCHETALFITLHMRRIDDNGEKLIGYTKWSCRCYNAGRW